MEKIQIREGFLIPELTQAMEDCLSAVVKRDFAALYAAEEIILDNTHFLCDLTAEECSIVPADGLCILSPEQEHAMDELLQTHGITRTEGARFFCIPQ